MHSAGTNSGPKGRLDISAVGPRFGSTKLASAAIRGALTLAVLCALLLIAARPAQAQTETVLYNFCGDNCPNGGGPQSSLISDGAGNFYGTTSYGGSGYWGTVFELSPNGSGGWNETVLYNFCSAPNCADGGWLFSSGLIFDSAGNLYGTGDSGGAYGYGVVFELSPVGGSWTETVLYSFTGGSDGAYPQYGVTMDRAGNLYGITEGSSTNQPSVFELIPSGGSWTEQTILSGGDVYTGGVAVDAAGNLFFVSVWNVYEASPNGDGGWTATIIHGFAGPPTDGWVAYANPVLDKAGNVYGTTNEGGAHGRGTVYELSPGENGQWTEKILYSFKGGKKDGDWPSAAIVFDAAGNIYGTTTAGGTYNNGTVFELVAPAGTGSYKEKVLWSFNGTDGAVPDGSLILDSADNLYGTAAGGGSSGYGVVFEVTPLAVTTTTLTSSPNPSTYGRTVTFTAVVASIVGAPPDGETVSFTKGKKVLGTGTLTAGSATFTTSTLPVGTNLIKAVYGGDSNLAGSTSKVVNQVVNKVATTTTLTSSPNPSAYGQAVTFTAAVTSSLGAPPDGDTVTFKHGTTVLGTGSLSGGSASFTTSALPVGTNLIKAVYGGDTQFAASTSNLVKQVVN
jgi:uncharacterized repeat protein (TIGR03803 family)